MNTLKELNEALDSNIPRSAVKEREGAGRRKFSYLSTDYVINRMNKVFGNLNWASETIENKAVFVGEVNGKQVAHYIARVKIEAQHLDENGRVVRTAHTGTGYGDGSDSSNPGKAHELAAKEAESDALKRACKNLGQSMGLALYDKDQTNVEDDRGSPSSAGKLYTGDKPGQPTPSASTNSDGRRPNPPATRPTFDRNSVNKRILTLAKVIEAKTQKKVTVSSIAVGMKEKYKVENKEQLTDEQAKEMLAGLEQQASAC